LGVDPGLGGALALVGPRQIYRVTDLEAFKFQNKGTATASERSVSARGSYLDVEKLTAAILAHFEGPQKPRLIAFEDVSAQTGAESASSMFKFGQVKGLISGIISAIAYDKTKGWLNPPIVYLRPAVWKANLGLSADKAKSLELARRIWPGSAGYFKLKKHADRAEAALIAYSGLAAYFGGTSGVLNFPQLRAMTKSEPIGPFLG
jgi:hypothetical protein